MHRKVLEVLSEVSGYRLGIEVLNQKPLVLVRHFSSGTAPQIDVHIECHGRLIWVSRRTTDELVNQFKSGTIPLEMFFIADISDTVDNDDSILVIDILADGSGSDKTYESLKDVPDDIKKGLEV